MNNLSKLILEKMEKESYTVSKFADKCGVSERQISDIKNRKVGNIELKTLVKICEAHDISYVDVFRDECQEKMMQEALSKFVLTNGEVTYILSNQRR